MEKNFSKQDKSNKLNKSKTCKHKSRKPLIFKMGGLICPNCRTVLHEAYSKKWLKEFYRLKELHKGNKNATP